MRLLNTIRPSTYQKKVLAKILSAATPKLAAAEISRDQNLISARDMLAKLGAITFTHDSAELTDIGQRLATSENICDDSGQLTDVGNQLLANGNQQAPQQTAPAPEMGDAGLGDIGFGESATLTALRELFRN